MPNLSAAYSGTRCNAEIPGTLDLAERARLAIHGICGCIDPNLDYYQYFNIWYTWRQPYLSHHGADSTCDPKFTESLPMLRLMCGSGEGTEIEQAQREAVTARIEDGLYWNKVDSRRSWRTTYNPAFDGQRREDEDLCSVGGQARMLRALVTLRELTGDTAWDSIIRPMIAALRRIAVYKDGYAYYPDGGYGEPFNYPRSGWLRTNEPLSETEGGEGSVVTYQAHQIQGLTRWYRLSGDESALELADRLTRFCLQTKFWGGLPDPRGPDDTMVGHIARRLPDPAGIAGAELGHWYSHFHARCIGLRGILEYARTVGDQRALEFVRQAYEYAWEFGIRRMGWVNCYPCSRMNGLMESCALGDLVAIAIRLSDAGIADYWDDVDAIVRNQLAEAQLVDEGILNRIAASSPERPEAHRSRYPQQETTEDAITRSLGIFCGVSRPDCIPGPWVMQCCTGNATQGLYYAWEGILRHTGEQAEVNLLLNRASSAADITSWLPFIGRVDIINKTLNRVSVRLPGGVSRRDVRCEVDGSPRACVWAGRYLLAEGLTPGQTLTLLFPVQEHSYSYTASAGTAAEQGYDCTFRGSTLVSIKPGTNGAQDYPLYQREWMRTERAPVRRVERFSADRVILHW